MKLVKILLATCVTLLATQSIAKNHEVKLLTTDTSGQMMLMSPDFLAIEVGDSVTFVPSDPTHNAQTVLSPDGAESFNTELGKTATVTFTKEGGYLYKCTPHFMMGMIGVIQVGNATNKAKLMQDWQGFEGQLVMNKERAPSLLAQLK